MGGLPDPKVALPKAGDRFSGEAADYAAPKRALSKARTVQLQAASSLACLSSVSASLTSNLPGASMFSDLTTPSLTSIE